jgi:signal transduction histidine kinase
MNGFDWVAFVAGASVAGVAVALLLIPAARSLQRRAETRAREAEGRARRAERLAELGSMTSGLAHEIKNPLSTLGLNAQLLAEDIADSELPTEQRERLLRRLGILGREAERLRNILTDFLRFAGRLKLDPQPTDLRALVDELADFLGPQCQQAGVLLRTDLPRDAVPAVVDGNLLKQATLNLMLNAIQSMSPTPETPGSRPVQADRRGELILRLESDLLEARLHVIDTGPGIEPQRLGEIFRPYVSSRPGGTGLGLPTARRIIEEHGGRLVAHSALGRGSDFVIHLPVAPTVGGERPPA